MTAQFRQTGADHTALEMSGGVALVHDYLNQYGGAERVILELSRLWPAAPIYTSLYRPGSTFAEFRERPVRASWLNRLPVDQRFRILLPLYPAAFHSLGVLDAELVVSSSSGWAHAVRTSPRSFHAVYCHTPARWLWGDYVRACTARTAMAPMTATLRRWDRRAAARADLYIANSGAIRDQIRTVYGIDAPVVHPPVDTERFAARPRGERLLTVSRLLGHKRLELLVAAATRLGIGLDIVGVGPMLDELRGIAGPTVTFHGRLDDSAVTELFEVCRAYCLPAREDFGIAPVEAQAAGKPVIALASGGALETVVDGVSGVLFTQQDVDGVIAAIRRSDDIATPPGRIAELAARFSIASFRSNLQETISAARAATVARPPA